MRPRPSPGSRSRSEARRPRSAPQGAAQEGAAGDTAFSPQPVVEAWLEKTLSENLGVWRDRQAMKGLVQYAVFQIRNRALGINSQTKRPVSRAQYDEKLGALKDILSEAEAAGVKVVLYTPAYRQDVPGP